LSLDWIYYAISWILLRWEGLWGAIGIPEDRFLGTNWTWILAIVFLVVTVRVVLFPVFVKQIKSQRKTLEIAPQLKKIQDKYRGKRDQFSREAMSRETMELYKRTGTNPLSSCLPLLLQMPIFFGLFSVLNDAQHDKAGVGLLSRGLADSFANSELFGAPLRATFIDNGGNALVMVIAAVMVILMTVSQFITQLQIMAKNMSPEAKNSPMFRQQKILLYILPLVFAVSGVAFPLGVMFYWLTSNFWTMGQQFLVIRNMPTPGSEAAAAREARLARRGKLPEVESGGAGGNTVVIEEKRPTQRAQPVGKARAKKTGGKKR